MNKFFGITTSEKIFKSIRKIKKDINKPVNIETIDFLSEKKKLKESDINFYRNTHLKKKKELSGAQLKWRVDVNNRILNTFKKSV